MHVLFTPESFLRYDLQTSTLPCGIVVLALCHARKTVLLTIAIGVCTADINISLGYDTLWCVKTANIVCNFPKIIYDNLEIN